MTNNIYIIIVGTDPNSHGGGIATALPGYFRALQHTVFNYDFLPTHHASAWGGKWRYWLTAILRIVLLWFSHALSHDKVVLYAHVGGGVPSFIRKGSLAAIGRLLGMRVVMQLHGLEVDSYLASRSGRLFFRSATSTASALCVLTPWWQLRLKAAEIYAPIFVVPNPLDGELEQIARADYDKAITKEDLVILCMTRVVEGKGVDLLIESVLLLPEYVRVVIAGNGAQLPSLKNRVRELNIEHRVDFRDWVAGKFKESLFREADIFCLPSSYDSFGMGFIEAMAHGLPVVALDWGPIKDVVPHGKCGLLVKGPDSTLLADAICCLVKDKALRTTLGRNGQLWVVEQFGASHVGHAIRSVMEHVCQ